MRKVNPKAKLKTLPEEVQEALWEWLAEDGTRTLAAAVEWLGNVHHIHTTQQRVSEWRAWYQVKLDIEWAQSDAKELEEELRALGSFDARQIEELGNVLFLRRATQSGDARTFARVADVVQGRNRIDGEAAKHKEKMELARKKLDLEKQRLKQAERVIEMQAKKIAALEAEEERRKKAAEEAVNRAKDGGASEDTIKAVREALGMR